MPGQHSVIQDKVAIEALKDHKTINKLAIEFDVHPTQINGLKKQLIYISKTAFSSKKQQDQQNQKAERDRLYAQIGKQKVELDWLKKKTGHLD